MSYECDNYALTEDERASGLGAVLCEYKYIHEIEEAIKKRTIIKITASTRNNTKMRNTIIKKLLQEQLEKMIQEYSKDEKLPMDFQNLAKQENCLKVLLKGFFKQKCHFVLSDEFVDEINEFIGILYINFNLDIIYNRVGEVQKFIHDKVQKENGKDSHKELDSVYMKNILSTARLHLNIYDIKNKEIESIILIKNKTIIEILKEYKSPTKINLGIEKKFIPVWKARKMKYLIEYMSSEFKEKITSLSELDIRLPQEDFKKLLNRI